MSSLLKELGDFIIASGEAPSYTVLYDTRLEEPTNAVMLFEYPGVPTRDAHAAIRAVQLVVRSATYEESMEVIYKLFALLDRPMDRVLWITVDRYCIIQAKQTPFKLDVDKRQRIACCFNMLITTKRK